MPGLDPSIAFLNSSSPFDCHSSGVPGVEIRNGLPAAKLRRAMNGMARGPLAAPASTERRPISRPVIIVLPILSLPLFFRFLLILLHGPDFLAVPLRFP